MPELPEVETIVRDLSPKISGLTIDSFKLLFPPLLRNKDLYPLHKIKGKRVLDVCRRGKMILINCQDDASLLFHLKMTGRLIFCSRITPRDKHTHFFLRFEGQENELRFRDIRKFGFLRCLRTSEVHLTKELRLLGPEPLKIDSSSFDNLFSGRKARIKTLLLDQRFIAGIGNIYADEILFRALIHPSTSASQLDHNQRKKLWEAMGVVLNQAIQQRGTSVQDFADSEGRRGSFQNFLQVYGREGLPCRACGERIERLRLSGRSTFFCPRCQEFNKHRDKKGRKNEERQSGKS